jgi:CheY-like chemotaxis protein
MLEDLGHDPVEALSGVEALEVLRAREDVDLLITDQAMPEMTGVELAEAAQALRPALPVILATGYANLPDGIHSALPRLQKPFAQGELAAAIRSAWARPDRR